MLKLAVTPILMLKLAVMPILCFTHSHLNQREYSMTYFGEVSKIYVISFVRNITEFRQSSDWITASDLQGLTPTSYP